MMRTSRSYRYSVLPLLNQKTYKKLSQPSQRKMGFLVAVTHCNLASADLSFGEVLHSRLFFVDIIDLIIASPIKGIKDNQNTCHGFSLILKSLKETWDRQSLIDKQNFVIANWTSSWTFNVQSFT